MRRFLLALAVVLSLVGCGSGSHGVPKGFVSETAAAYGPHDVWILGRGNTLVRSTDAGLTFGTAVKLNTDTGTAMQWQPSLSVTSTGARLSAFAA